MNVATQNRVALWISRTITHRPLHRRVSSGKPTCQAHFGAGCAEQSEESRRVCGTATLQKKSWKKLPSLRRGWLKPGFFRPRPHNRRDPEPRRGRQTGNQEKNVRSATLVRKKEYGVKTRTLSGAFWEHATSQNLAVYTTMMPTQRIPPTYKQQVAGRSAMSIVSNEVAQALNRRAGSLEIRPATRVLGQRMKVYGELMEHGEVVPIRRFWTKVTSWPDVSSFGHQHESPQKNVAETAMRGRYLETRCFDRSSRSE